MIYAAISYYFDFCYAIGIDIDVFDERRRRIVDAGRLSGLI